MPRGSHGGAGAARARATTVPAVSVPPGMLPSDRVESASRSTAGGIYAALPSGRIDRRSRPGYPCHRRRCQTGARQGGRLLHAALARPVVGKIRQPLSFHLLQRLPPTKSFAFHLCSSCTATSCPRQAPPGMGSGGRGSASVREDRTAACDFEDRDHSRAAYSLRFAGLGPTACRDSQGTGRMCLPGCVLTPDLGVPVLMVRPATGRASFGQAPRIGVLALLVGAEARLEGKSSTSPLPATFPMRCPPNRAHPPRT